MGSEAAFLSVPSSVGPYAVIARLDAEIPGLPLPEERFVARSRDGVRTVLVSVPVPGTDPGRFLVEAEASRYLLGPWVSPATHVSAPGVPAWHARPYLPALTLPTALAVYGGPLPEHTVRALGACLAEALGVVHGQALAHAGVSPGAVLLAWDGPRLGCFGAVRAAAPDGEPRSGRPGLEPGSLPPEQAAGGRPQPPGDIYALGATLAYAATGRTVPGWQELPASLRGVVTDCLAQDPAARPRPAEVLSALREADGPRPGSRTAHGAGVDSAHFAAVGSEPGVRSDVAPAHGWLPGRLTAAVARQSADVLAAETAATETAAPVPTAVQSPGPSPGARTQGPAMAVTGAQLQGPQRRFPAEPPLPPTPPSGRPVVHHRQE